MRSFFFSRRKSPTLAGKHTLAKFIRLHGLLNHDSIARSRTPFAQHPHTHPRVLATHNHPYDHHYYRRRRRFPFALFSTPYRPSPLVRPRPASAAAGNDGAYFIFKAGRIDNLQWRYVNAPSRTQPPRVLPSGGGEFPNGEDGRG